MHILRIVKIVQTAITSFKNGVRPFVNFIKTAIKSNFFYGASFSLKCRLSGTTFASILVFFLEPRYPNSHPCMKKEPKSEQRKHITKLRQKTLKIRIPNSGVGGMEPDSWGHSKTSLSQINLAKASGKRHFGHCAVN